MIMDGCVSEIGRSTEQHLNNLRRQLGHGVDPAFNYSGMIEHQKKLAEAGRQGTKKKSERHGEGSAAPTSGLDLLKKTLREVVGVGAGLEDPEAEEAEATAHNRRAHSTPADIREQREQSRNTSAFTSCTRDSLKKLDIENRFRAPPIGSYRPKDAMLHPRVKGSDFGILATTKSLTEVAKEKEIERLQEEGQPYDHLVKWGANIELNEEIPEKPRPRFKKLPQFGKDLPRPDMTKLANIEYNDNSFTAGVLHGDLKTSQFQKQPCFDFAKVSTAEPKPREYFFQPGQYKVKYDSSKPKQELKNIPFHQQTKRPEMKQPPKPTDNLPDRSLARPSAMGGSLSSCPLLERRVKDVSIAKVTNRKPPYEYKPEPYDTSDPRIEESVLATLNSYDAFQAIRPTKPGPKPVEEFKKSLTRLQHHKIQRSYANDMNLTLRKTNITRGPVSTELLPMDSIDSGQSLNRRVLGKDMTRMAGREPSKDYTEQPPRQRKDLGEAMNFERGTRSGDARCGTQSLSNLAGGITQLRGSRSYDALPKHELPRPSFEKADS